MLFRSFQIPKGRKVRRGSDKTHLTGERAKEMESQNLRTLVAKRDEIMAAICLIEARPSSRGSLAAKQLIERLRLKVEWLNKRIQMESTRAANAA